MKNFFSALGFPPSLVLDESKIESAWRDRTRHVSGSAESPDPAAGGTGKDLDLTLLHEARSVLLDPGKRIAHWLELSGVAISRAAAMDPDLMDLFGSLGETLSRTDDFLSRHRSTSSAVGRALLTREAVSVQLELQEKMQVIQKMKQDTVSAFPSLEAEGKAGEYSHAVATWQRLRFLGKWESQCQERLLSLLAC